LGSALRKSAIETGHRKPEGRALFIYPLEGSIRSEILGRKSIIPVTAIIRNLGVTPQKRGVAGIA